MAKSDIILPELPELEGKRLRLLRLAGASETIYHVTYDQPGDEILGIMVRDDSGFWEFEDQRRVPDWLAALQPKLANLIVVNGDV